MGGGAPQGRPNPDIAASPRHHPAEPLLLEYAAGVLPSHAYMVLAGHIGACAHCARIVAEAEATGGALLADLPPAAMAPDALALVLARAERPAPPAPPAPPKPADWIAVPNAVLRAARTRRRWIAPGVWTAPVSRGRDGARSYLLGVAAGISVPRHTHRGWEMTCVLKGAYCDGDTRHGAGDFAFCDDTIEHKPESTAEGDCITLIAAQNALIARDWIGRVFQPWAGV
jgi:putative transcriptional regulator